MGTVTLLRQRVRELEAENASLQNVIERLGRTDALQRLLGHLRKEIVVDDTTTIDPRIIAEALQMDTLDLARVLTRWAKEALPILDFDSNYEPPSLDSFDDAVLRARRYLESAHAANLAWNTDNPLEEPEVE